MPAANDGDRVDGEHIHKVEHGRYMAPHVQGVEPVLCAAARCARQQAVQSGSASGKQARTEDRPDGVSRDNLVGKHHCLGPAGGAGGVVHVVGVVEPGEGLHIAVVCINSLGVHPHAHTES